MIHKFMLSILGLLLLAACGAQPNPVPSAAWTYRRLADPQWAGCFAFAARNQVEELYLGGSDLLPGRATALAGFLEEARDRNLRVSLVLGRNAWLSAEGRAEAMAQVQAVLAFTRAQRQANRPAPAALHLDLEPQALPGWHKDWVALSQAYLDLLEAVKGGLNGEVPLAVDIPVWWDQRRLAWRGHTRPLCAWVMTLADRIVLMDYRVETKEILAGAKGNLRLAAAMGRPVVVGLAVHCSSDPDNRATSFCRKGGKALGKAMAEVDHKLAGRAGYGGMAVFTLEDWQVLRP